MSDVFDLLDLASERLGGAVLAASDEFFGPKEALLRRSPPISLPNEHTDRGKWVDGWETRRLRGPGHNWCIVRLGLPGVLRGILVDTSHFASTYPEHCSIDACAARPGVDVAHLTGPTASWVEVIPRSPLQGEVENAFLLEDPRQYTHLRLHIYPDGGVARLRVHGEVVPAYGCVADLGGSLDLASVKHGGQVLACSDELFGACHNLIMPGEAFGVSDGWHTRRRRDHGHDWAILKLGAASTIHRVEVDTSYFRGDFPESCSIEACDAEGASLADLTGPSGRFRELMPRVELAAHARHSFVEEVKNIGPVTHVRFNIHPDGGVSRLRLYGTVSAEGREMLGLRRLNASIQHDAEAALHLCCGSMSWIRGMVQQRPFRSRADLFGAADAIWSGLRPEDWIEAFRSHSRIGEPEPSRSRHAASSSWAQEEQAGLREARPETLSAIVQASRWYEATFGFVFVVSAAGKSAEDLLAILRSRLRNPPTVELLAAAEEQRSITRLRLGKLLLS